MFNYFLKKKRERAEFKRATLLKDYKGYSKGTKAAIGWIILVLSVNSINYIAYTVIEILIAVDISLNKESPIFDIFTAVSLFWIDVLNLTNGLCFLLLFKKMAEKPKFQREFYTT